MIVIPQAFHDPAYHSMMKNRKLEKAVMLMITVLYLQSWNPQVCTKWVLKACLTALHCPYPCFFICSSLNDDINDSDYIVLNGRIIHE